ncbi:MAG TPA: hypothetical protein VF949_01495 [Reyranella sp.]
MKTDFEQWLTAQFADTGPFTAFIVLVQISGEAVSAVKSSYAQLIGDDMPWAEMRALLDGARAHWDGVAFFVGLDHAGGPLSDAAAKAKLKEVEADVLADPLALNRGLFFDRHGRNLRVDEVS